MGTNTDKALYLINTKKAIKEALQNKGVEVSDFDTFRSYAEKIENIQTGGGESGETGGDLIYALNGSSKIPVTGDKVLIKLGTTASTQFDNTYSTTLAYSFPKIFYDNNTFIGSVGDSSKRLQFIDDSWIENTINYVQNSRYCNAEWLENGLISVASYRPYNNKYNFILDVNGLTATGAGKYYGEYNGIHYISPTTSCHLYSYDINNHTQKDLVKNITGSARSGYLVGNKFLSLNTGLKFSHFTIEEDNSVTLNNSSTIADDIITLGVTGLEVGDFIFATTNYSAYETPASSTEAYLYLYQIQSDYSIAKVTVSELEWLESTNCRLTYDRRNKVLMVGTKIGIFAYQFNDNKTFSELPLNIILNMVEGSDPYKAFMSPDKTRILISLTYKENSTYYDAWVIYQLADDNYSIIDNKTLNYQPASVYTGIATGNVDENGNYEVKTILARG